MVGGRVRTKLGGKWPAKPASHEIRATCRGSSQVITDENMVQKARLGGMSCVSCLHFCCKVQLQTCRACRPTTRSLSCRCLPEAPGLIRAEQSWLVQKLRLEKAHEKAERVLTGCDFKVLHAVCCVVPGSACDDSEHAGLAPGLHYVTATSQRALEKGCATSQSLLYPHATSAGQEACVCKRRE